MMNRKRILVPAVFLLCAALVTLVTIKSREARDRDELVRLVIEAYHADFSTNSPPLIRLQSAQGNIVERLARLASEKQSWDSGFTWLNRLAEEVAERTESKRAAQLAAYAFDHKFSTYYAQRMLAAMETDPEVLLKTLESIEAEVGTENFSISCYSEVGRAKPELVPKIIERFDSPVHRHELSMVVKNFRQRADVVVPLLRRYAVDDDPKLQDSAIESLYAFGTDARSAIPELTQALKSPVPGISNSASFVLRVGIGIDAQQVSAGD